MLSNYVHLPTKASIPLTTVENLMVTLSSDDILRLEDGHYRLQVMEGKCWITLGQEDLILETGHIGHFHLSGEVALLSSLTDHPLKLRINKSMRRKAHA